ncbi:serine hydrolase domain-containing protein [Paraflavitalea speifideaquila]|uniref:serine hydrolase domain-containing protein n=1 Tax=Paraflavitalea speifideaquila TaxID=3076558 RepID=UPI0028E7CEF2|nr:serine hydrolase domain-containing protein [Paraflavitalea speifideiaquila]
MKRNLFLSGCLRAPGKQFVLTVLLVLVAVIGRGQKSYGTLLTKYLEAQAAINHFSGVVLVSNKGTVVVEKAYGLANREWNMANTLQTKFRIGSITKQFTAAAIMQLYESGKLKIEDKLSRYFPAFPKGDSVTIQMLLNHTSGINSNTAIPRPASLSKLPYDKAAVIALFRNEAYEFPPGTKYKYNNSGYFLLGCIIEIVSGDTYANYIVNNLVKKRDLKIRWSINSIL